MDELSDDELDKFYCTSFLPVNLLRSDWKTSKIGPICSAQAIWFPPKPKLTQTFQTHRHMFE